MFVLVALLSDQGHMTVLHGYWCNTAENLILDNASYSNRVFIIFMHEKHDDAVYTRRYQDTVYTKTLGCSRFRQTFKYNTTSMFGLSGPRCCNSRRVVCNTSLQINNPMHTHTHTWKERNAMMLQSVLSHGACFDLKEVQDGPKCHHIPLPCVWVGLLSGMLL